MSIYFACVYELENDTFDQSLNSLCLCISSFIPIVMLFLFSFSLSLFIYSEHSHITHPPKVK